MRDTATGRSGLLAELARLRRLPVIQTCRACGWRYGTSYTECMHPKATGPCHVIMDAEAVPPSWCPLRDENKPCLSG